MKKIVERLREGALIAYPTDSSYALGCHIGDKKTIERNGLAVEHFIYPPAGGDEALLERLVFTNLSNAKKSIRYFDYWDVAWWLLKPTDPFVTESAYDPAKVKTEYDPTRATIKVVSQAAQGDFERPDRLVDPSPKVSFVTFLDDPLDGFEGKLMILHLGFLQANELWLMLVDDRG